MDTHRLSQTVQPLLGWFQTHARALPWRADREPYHVWLSEIMLQQTRVEAVRGYYARFLAAAPDVFALAALPEAQLLKLWEGLVPILFQYAIPRLRYLSYTRLLSMQGLSTSELLRTL